MQIFKGKKSAVLGMGISGRSAAHFLLVHGATVCGVDQAQALLENHPEIQEMKQRGLTICLEEEFLHSNTTSFDLLILSPGIQPNHPAVLKAKEKHTQIIGEIELGCLVAKNPIVAITGTNGKTTTTLLVKHILVQSGLSAHALGNVGTPFTRELLQISSQDPIVLELSSYQLETLYQNSLDHAVILNITPDHLDRYPSMEAYAAAKCSISRFLKPGGTLYMEEKAWQTFGYLLPKEIKPLLYGYDTHSFIYTDLHSVYREGKKIFPLPSHLQNRKSHEIENILAAYALCHTFSIPDNFFLPALASFKKPSHRIEFILEHDNIRYYDDSKGTNIDAVIRAVQSLQGSIILIAGGVDKGSSYTPWIQECSGIVKEIFAIGEAASKIQKELSHHFPVTPCPSLEIAVQKAIQNAIPGDTVLLSPGCSSFDQFTDYAHRGREFQCFVRSIIGDSVPKPLSKG